MSEPPRKKKKPTPTTKAHRFEPFTRRISKIKIDPVHTVQRSRVPDDHNDLSQSYFRSALDEWTELNLTATFTSFLNKASPLSESLPQLLHHADTIFQLLLDHIEKKDELALEPLLSLVAHLAHDLGQSFEKYFADAVKSITHVSACVEDPAAIEACFTCLAWMFKYLSRMLVADLRPLLEIMIPYMSAKKEYVRRFSAESLAFLVRKAALLYSKKPTSLRLAVTFLFEQLKAETRRDETGAYEFALKTLFSESAMGVEAQLHSSAADLFSCALSVLSDADTPSVSDPAVSVVEGAIISLIHQTNARGYKPLQDVIVSGLVQDKSAYIHAKLLLASTGTRRGTRILDWSSVIKVCKSDGILEPRSTYSTDTVLTYLSLHATILQYAPMDQLLPHLSHLLEQIVEGLTPSDFFVFCEVVADLGKQRFVDLLLPRLQQYISAGWKQSETGLCYLLSQLKKKDVSNSKAGSTNHVKLPSDWKRSILLDFETASAGDHFPESFSKYFQLMHATHFAAEKDVASKLQTILHTMVNSCLHRTKGQLTMPWRLSLGWALQKYLDLVSGEVLEIWKGLVEEQQETFYMVPFLEACELAVTCVGKNASATIEAEPFVSVLVENMLSDSNAIRKLSLKILNHLSQQLDLAWLSETSSLLLELLETPYLPSSARQISMLIRKLPALQTQIKPESAFHRLVPLFAMGMLRQYHDQARKDLCLALAHMASNGRAEDIIIQIATSWLQSPGMSEQKVATSGDTERQKKLSPFECSNLAMIQKCVADNHHRHGNANDLLREEFEDAHRLCPPRTPIDGRSLALQLFSEMPELAEKRSRILVPVFLSVSDGKLNHHVPQSDESTSSNTISPEIDEQPWTLRDRKAFLDLMSKFVNPRVLYRSSEVHKVLLELLTNGNSEVRKVALLTVLNWKDPALRSYEDALIRVAEEKSATTELALIMSDVGEIGSIKAHDRPQVVPVLLRLIFGQLVGRSGTHGSQEAKRKSILRLLFRMSSQEIQLFLEITLGRLGELSLQSGDGFSDHWLASDIISPDQQYGFLRMMLSMMDILQSQFAPYGEKVVSSILYCTARACRQVYAVPDEASSASNLARSIRKVGIQCLTLIFEHSSELDWTPYMPIIFSEVVSPRLPEFAAENTQAVSVLLRLFAVWAKSERTLEFLAEQGNTLTVVLCTVVSAAAVRDEVRVFVVEEVLIPMAEQANAVPATSTAAANILQHEMEGLLGAVSTALELQTTKDVLVALTRLITLLTAHASGAVTVNRVLQILVKLLHEPNQRMPPHVKGNLLQAIYSLLLLGEIQISSASQDILHTSVSTLYNYFKDQPNREILGKILELLNQDVPESATFVQICNDINANSTVQLNEVDFDRRIQAYNAVNELSVSEHGRKAWLPILCNLLFFARTADDLSLRPNAVSSLRRFVTEACLSESMEAQDLVRNVLLPAFRKGSRDDSEIVRADFVAMFGLVVNHLKDAPELQDMKVLLVGGDEEASFFSNILHIQQHRRSRALRRLLSETEKGSLKPANISEYFLPLLEKFINDESGDESAQGVKGQSIAATSELLQQVEWKAFRKMFRQYRQDLDTSARPEKDSIKLLNNAADALTLAIKYNNQAGTEMDSGRKPALAATLPVISSARDELKTNFIPKLSKFIHHKDEAEISLRIPAAKVAIKLINLMAEDDIPHLVAPILLDISQILRSRTQESRDIARNTLAEIVVLLGPGSVHFVLKELRSTLTRGYQLHVLSYTMHTVLLACTPHHQPGDLDYCIEDLVSVIMDDVFGATGQEKENQDYISTMKEVKKNKSFDSMELLARTTGVRALSKLLKPFQSLLTGNLNTKQVRQVDELLRRAGVGISHNPSASSRELLIFAYELVQAFYKEKAKPLARALTNDEKNRERFIVQLEGANKTTAGVSSSLLYKLSRFALDIVRSTLSKNSELFTAENVHGFLPVIGDALISGQEDVKVSAFRLLSSIAKLSLPELEQNASIYVMEAVKVVRGANSTNDEISQAALKLVTALLRDLQDVQVKDSDIAFLLHRTMPDLEEPDRQGVTFNFIKSVMARQYELPELYEIMDKIAIIMVTNHTRNARDVARGVYVRFLLDYPQSKSRWSKQIKFLVKNLEYQYPEGRQSVMEAVYNLMQKLDSTTSQEHIPTFFIPIILRMANDDNKDCREMAGALLSQLYKKSGTIQRKTLLEPLRDWVEQSDNSTLTKLSIQAWAVFFDANPDNAGTEVSHVRTALARAIQNSDYDDSDWEIQYLALSTWQKLVSLHPATVMTQKQYDTWSAISSLLLSQHAWIQSSAMESLGSLFQDCAPRAAKGPSLTSSYGLKIESPVILTVLKNTVKVLKRNAGNSDLADKTLPNLLFLARYVQDHNLTVDINPSRAQDTAVNNDGDDDDDDDDVDDGDLSSSSDREAVAATRSITAIQYLLDQCTSILRREPNKYTTSAFLPRISTLQLLTNLIPHLSNDALNAAATALLMPLTYITDPATQAPRSADSTFPETYATYVSSAHSVLEAVQSKLGDAVYVKLLTAASRIMRERRESRRRKRAIERVTEPERAARLKKRKVDRKKDRKKEIKDMYRKGRRKDLGF